MPYGPDMPVEKIQCRNHLLRNHAKRMTVLAENTKSGYPMDHRRLLKSNTQRLGNAVRGAIRFRKVQMLPSKKPVPLNDKIRELKLDIDNAPYHIFGQHSRCPDRGFVCSGPKPGEINMIPAMAASGIFGEILKINFSCATFYASSLILDVDNNPSEQFNSVVNVFVGGKRRNLALRGSYKTRCEAAAVSFNTPGEYLRLVHKAMLSSSPGRFQCCHFDQKQ